MTLLVLMRIVHGTMAGAVCASNKNTAAKRSGFRKQRGREAKSASGRRNRVLDCGGRSERGQPCPRVLRNRFPRTRLSALRTVSSWNVLQNMRQYNSLRLFKRTIHQLYIRVQNHVGIFDFLESGIANPHATDVDRKSTRLNSS